MKFVIKLAILWSAAALLSAPCVAQETPKQKQTTLSISKETTYITEPLDKHGYVDFLSAANKRYSKGVTPTNNFEVAIRQIMPVEIITDEMQKEYFEKLGVEIPSQNGVVNFGSSFMDYVGKRVGANETMSTYNEVQMAPWKPGEYPAVDEWLKQEEQRFARLVAACERSHCYTPYVFVPMEGETTFPLIMTLLPAVQERRDLGRALQIRINKHLGTNNLESAWSDTLAGMKMARLTGSGFTLIELLVGVAIDGMMFESAARILQSDALTDELANQILKDLKELDYLPSARRSVEFAERLMVIEMIQVLSQQEDLLEAIKLLNLVEALSFKAEKPAETLVVFQEPNAGPNKPKQGFNIATGKLSEILDWNEAAKLINQWYDRMSVAVGEEGFAKRQELQKKLKNEMPIVKANGLFGRLAAAKNRKEMGIVVGKILLSLTAPALSRVAEAQFESSERLDVLRMAYASEVYFRTNREYPEKLGKLVPKYFESIPRDRFSAQPLQYRRQHNGFVVYSAGRNGKNDLGRDRKDAEQRKNANWDDVVVRIKRARP